MSRGVMEFFAFSLFIFPAMPFEPFSLIPPCRQAAPEVPASGFRRS